MAGRIILVNPRAITRCPRLLGCTGTAAVASASSILPVRYPAMSDACLPANHAWTGARRALRREDQIVFDSLFESVRPHAQAGAYFSSADPFPVMLLCMLLEERKSRIALEARIRELEQRLS